MNAETAVPPTEYVVVAVEKPVIATVVFSWTFPFAVPFARSLVTVVIAVMAVCACTAAGVTTKRVTIAALRKRKSGKDIG